MLLLSEYKKKHMPVNLMQGKLDSESGDDNSKKNNSIDLTLEKNDSKKKEVVTSPVAEIKKEKHPEVKEIKVKVPSDINLTETKTEGGSLRVVTGIVVLLMLSTGVLLFLLNSESQDLRGSVNVLPETNSTQIVDDILAEDFSNDAQENATETEQVDIEESASETVADTPDESLEIETITTSVDEPIVIDTSSIIAQPEAEPEVIVPEEIQPEVDPIASSLPELTEGDIIANYNIQSSADVTNELLTDTSNNNSNDFAPEIAQSQSTVMEEVSESQEIQGETGPGLWISVIVASILSYAYARRDERQLD